MAPDPRTWPGHADALRQLSLLYPPGSVIELRAFLPGQNGRPQTASGYFDNPEDLLRAAASVDATAQAIYVTLNPVRSELLARAKNRLVFGPKHTTSDDGVERRTALLLDFDPRRASGISTTDAEKALAFALAEEVRCWLASLGFPESLVGDSGNGAHLVYAIDLPAQDGGLVERLLKALAFRFDTNAVTLDQKVSNPSRITKLFGSMVRKGDATADRPHRRSQILSAPDRLEVVPEVLLREVAAMLPEEPPRPEPKARAAHEQFDFDKILPEHGLAVHRTAPWNGGQKWIFEVCPFNAEHTDRSAYLLRFPSGALAAGCHHNGCQGKSWRDLAPLFGLRPGTSGSSVGGPGGPSAGEWPDPRPIPDELPPVERFTFDLLPDSLAPWLADIAYRVQCPPDYLAATTLVGLAAVVGRKVAIRPKQRDDWTVVPNLWGDLIGRPGVLKTPAMQECLRPLRRIEQKAKEEFERNKKEHLAAEFIAEEVKKAQEAEVKKVLKEEGADAAREKALALFEEKPEPPVRRRLIVNDVTVEKLGVLLNQNPNGLLLNRDELIGFLRSLEKEGSECARAFYLEAWNGTGRFTYDRVVRGTIEIEAAIVSILGCIQPGPLGSYMRLAVQATGSDDGFIQRFQIAVWPDISKNWENVDQWPNSIERERAFKAFERLDRIGPDDVGAEEDKLDAEALPFLRFTPEAQECFDEWHTALNRRIRSGDEHPAFESHLSKYRSLIPSIALLLHLAEGGVGPVTLTQVDRAIRWGRYLESHARRIYSVAVNADVIAAKAIAKKILSGDLKDGFALRDVYRRGWTGLTTRDEAAPGINLLIDLDWLAERKEQGSVGAPKTFYLINPKVFEKPTQGPDRTAKTRSQSLPEREQPAGYTDTTDGTPCGGHADADGPDVADAATSAQAAPGAPDRTDGTPPIEPREAAQPPDRTDGSPPGGVLAVLSGGAEGLSALAGAGDGFVSSVSALFDAAGEEASRA